ncbi:MAG: PilZ domain-containing protein [Solirubrobacterales bacterium]|nr:PilZ domain-containing protein [Solirubrobacterales bacterium]
MDVLLERAQPVDVVLDGGWRLTAHVANVGLDHVDLSVDGAFELPGQLRWCGATIAWRTPGGAAQRRGMLVAHGRGMRLHSTEGPVNVQRRRFVRVPVEVTAAVIAEDRRLLTRTRDLSIGGMLLTTAETLGVHEHVRFAVELGDTTISGDGEVVRGTAEGSRAVRFEKLDPGAEQAISRFVAERQRSMALGHRHRRAALAAGELRRMDRAERARF